MTTGVPEREETSRERVFIDGHQDSIAGRGLSYLILLNGVAAIVMVGGFEALRHTEGLQSFFGEGFDPALYRMLLFGVAMVGIMVWRPRGIIGSRTPSIALGKARPIPKDLVEEGSA